MSEQSMGPGWWMASDGLWYSPEQHPDAVAAAEAPAEPPAYEAPAPEPVEPPAYEPPAYEPTAPVGVAPGPPPGEPEPYVWRPQGSGAAPTGAPPAFGPPPTAGSGGGGANRGRLIAIAAVVVLLLAAAAFAIANRDDDSTTTASSDSSSSSTRSSSTKSSSTKSSSTKSSSTKSSSGDPLAITAPAGYTAYRDDTNGFALALPDSYKTVDLSSGDIDSIIAALEQSNPGLADVLKQNRTGLQQGITVFAFDTTSVGPFTDNVNIIKLSQRIDPTSSLFFDEIKSQLGSVGATDVVTSTRTLPDGSEAGTATFIIPTTGSDGSPLEVHGQQGYVSSGGKTWIISASTEAGTSAFDVMLDSFTTG